MLLTQHFSVHINYKNVDYIIHIATFVFLIIINHIIIHITYIQHWSRYMYIHFKCPRIYIQESKTYLSNKEPPLKK